MERIDAFEEQNLLFINSFFPFKRFWKNIISIFTHYFYNPSGDDLKEMSDSNSKIIFSIIEKTKCHSEIKMKYVNSFCPIRNKKQFGRKNEIRNIIF